MARSFSFLFLLAALACALANHRSSAFVTPSPRTFAGPPATRSASSMVDWNKFHLQQQFSSALPPLDSSMQMSSGPQDEATKSNLPFWLDPGTKGGAVVLSIILFIIPLIGYSIVTNVFGVDGIEAGKWIGIGFTAFSTLLWLSTYLFRVATKDMTYARQLKDYENAVIAKRLEELDDDEIQALVEDIERDDF